LATGAIAAVKPAKDRLVLKRRKKVLTLEVFLKRKSEDCLSDLVLDAGS
jgi:hypothetical protein